MTVAVRCRDMLIRLARFRHLRTRLAVLYGLLFALSLVGVAAVGQIMILAHARESIRAELSTGASVYDRIWAFRVKSLSDSADVLARDFGFRSAVADGDAATIESAVVNLQHRAGVERAFVVDQATGRVIGHGSRELRGAVGQLPFALAEGRRDAIVVANARVYRAVVAPILAPTEIGWVIFAVPLDSAEISEARSGPLGPLDVRPIARGAMPMAAGVEKFRRFSTRTRPACAQRGL